MMHNDLLKIVVTSLLTMSLASCTAFQNMPTSQTNAQMGIATTQSTVKTKAGTYRRHTATGEAKWPLGANNVAESAITGNLWDRLPQSFQLTNPETNQQVQEQINWFMHHQGYLYRTAKRAAPYMYYIFEQVQARNLPGELVLLPMLESAYYPGAISGPGAAGLWQLMPGTANKFGLKQDWWYDGRRDIYASTNAALDYFTYLQNYFNGNWMLAIAAYDSGEGSVQAAIHKNARQGKNTDFWSLPLPLETRSYVPRLLALAHIINHRDQYPIDLPPINDQPYLEQVDLGAQIDLTDAAKIAGISLEELKQLNPGYSHHTTDPHGPFKLILPIDKITAFKESLAQLPTNEKTVFAKYKVTHKDTLAKIADRYQVTIDELRRVNHLNSYRAPFGKELIIPTVTQAISLDMKNTVITNQVEIADNATDDVNKSFAQQTLAQATATISKIPNNNIEEDDANEDNSNTVVDTAVKVSTSKEVEHQKIPVAKANKIEVANKSNEKLLASKITTTNTSYIIKKGDTLAKIAKNNHISVAELQKFNHINSKNLKPGKTLILAKTTIENVTSTPTVKETTPSVKTTTVATTSPTPANKVTKPQIARYQIRSGDTLSSIANHYNVKITHLKQWNKLADNISLKPGKQLVIYTN